MRALDNIPKVSANQPTVMTDQEVYGFLDETAEGISYLILIRSR